MTGHGRSPASGAGLVYVFIGLIVGCATENVVAEVGFGLVLLTCLLLIVRSMVRMLR